MARTVWTAPMCLALILATGLTALAHAEVVDVQVSPEKPVQGDTVKVFMLAAPNEEVKVSISFEKPVSVLDGRYEYKINAARIPSAPNSFTVTASNVKNLGVAVKVFILWFTKSVEASNGTATLSQSNVPAGTYDVVIYGEALAGVSTINLQITASTIVITNENGYYEYRYDTTNIPPGTFNVKVGRITKTITLLEPDTGTAHSFPDLQAIDLQ